MATYSQSYVDPAQYVKEQLELRALEAKKPTSMLGAGARTGLYGLLSGYGALGAALGLDTQDFSDRMAEEAAFYARHAPGTTTFTEALGSEGSLSDWLAYIAGQSIPYLAQFALGARAGGLVGAGTRAVAMQAAAGEVAKRALAKKLSQQVGRQALAGGALASYPSSVGTILRDQYEESGEYDAPVAGALGVPYAALNALGGEAALIRALTGNELRKRGALELAKHAGAKAVTTGAIEGSAELGQEVLSQLGRMGVNEAATLLGGDAPHRYLEGFAGGFGLGGLMGGAAAPFTSTVEREAELDAKARQVDDLAKQVRINALLSPSPLALAAQARLDALASEEAEEYVPYDAARGALAAALAATSAYSKPPASAPAVPVLVPGADAFVTAATTIVAQGSEPANTKKAVVRRIEDFATAPDWMQEGYLDAWQTSPSKADRAAADLILSLADKFTVPAAVVDRMTAPQRIAQPAAAPEVDSSRGALARILSGEVAAMARPETTQPLPEPDRLIDIGNELLRAQQVRQERRAQELALAIDMRAKTVANLTTKYAPVVKSASDLVARIEKDLGDTLTDPEKTRVLRGLTAIKTLAKVPDPERVVPNELDVTDVIPEAGARQRKDAFAKAVAQVRKDIEAQKPVGVNFGGRPEFELGRQDIQVVEEPAVGPVFDAGPVREPIQGDLFASADKAEKSKTRKTIKLPAKAVISPTTEEKRDERQETLRPDEGQKAGPIQEVGTAEKDIVAEEAANALQERKATEIPVAAPSGDSEKVGARGNRAKAAGAQAEEAASRSKPQATKVVDPLEARRKQVEEFIAAPAVKEAAPASKPDQADVIATLRAEIAALEEAIEEAQLEGRPVRNKEALLAKKQIDLEKAEGRRVAEAVVEPDEDFKSSIAEEQTPETLTTPEGRVTRLRSMSLGRKSDYIATFVERAKTVTITDLLTQIKTHSRNKAFRALAKRLIPLVENTAVLSLDIEELAYLEKGKLSFAAGDYDSNYNIITLSRSGRNEATVLHEAVHAATVGRIKQAEKLLREPFAEMSVEDRRILAAYNEIASLMERARSELDPTAYAFKDIYEFMSEVHSNRDFRKQLAALPVSPQDPLGSPSFLQRLWRWIADLLNTPLSVLQAVEEKGFELFSESRALGVGPTNEPDIFHSPPAMADVLALGDRVLPAVGAGMPGVAYYGDALADVPPIKPTRIGVVKVGEERFSGVAGKRNLKEVTRKMQQGLRDLLQHVTTTQFRASRSAGFAAVHSLVRQGLALTQWTRSVLNDMLKPAFVSTSEDVTNKVSTMLALTTTIRMAEFNKNADDLYAKYFDKEIMVDDAVDASLKHPLPELARIGIHTPEEFSAGLRHPQTGKIIKFDVTADSDLYRRYLAVMTAMQHGAIIQYNSKVNDLQAQFERTQARAVQSVFSDMVQQVRAKNLIFDLAAKHQSMMYENAKFNTESGKGILFDPKAQERAQELRQQVHGLFSGEATEAQLDKIAELSGIDRGRLTQVFNDFVKAKASAKKVTALLDAYEQLVELSRGAVEARLFAVKSIAGGYVPMNRAGRYYISAEYVIAEGPNEGTVLTRGDISDELYALLPMIRSDHIENYLHPYAEIMQRQFDEIGAFDVKFEDGSTEKVRMRMKSFKDEEGVTRYAAEVSGGVESTRIDYLGVLSVLESIGASPSMQERAMLIKKLTAADAAVRHNLQRLGHPGFDPDFITSVSQHLNATAALVGKRHVEPAIRAALSDDTGLWGDGKLEIATAQAIYDNVKDKTSIESKIALRNLAQTKRMYEGQTPDQIATSKRQAQELAEFYLDELGFDIGHESFSTLRSVTAVTGLGLSVASALNNLSSLPMHAFSALATFNPKTGFGGGFGAKPAFEALTSAFKTLSPYIKIGLKRAITEDTKSAESFFRDMIQKAANSPDRMANGYSELAWRFMLRETEQGGLKPQAYNAMMGTSRQSTYGTVWDRFSSRAMALFATTEEMNRMTTALAAYTLYYNEGIAGGMTPELADRYAANNAEYTVRFSQGEYSAANRPRLFRDGVGSLVFMYKTFAVTSVELLANLSPQGKALFLGMLFSVAGAQGVPFWEELLAILDTLSQKFGIGQGNAEREFRRFLKALGQQAGIPLDKILLNGVVDTVTGVSVGSRMGIQVGIPLIGLGRAGADWEKELGKALGAPVGMLGSAVRAAGAAAQGDWQRFLKEQPVTGVRNIGDAISYARYDAVLNKKGQRVVDADAVDVLARVLGYYPQNFKVANDIVRLEDYTRNYARQLSEEFMVDYRRAAVANDTQAMKEVVEAVREHNKLFAGTALEIKEFQRKANRAAKEARQSLTQRMQRSLSKAQREDYFAGDVE